MIDAALVGFCIGLGLCVPLAAQPADSNTPLRTIAFGSCARERQAQPIWIEIIAADPQIFLFIGDNQYADFWEKDGKMVMEPVPNAARIKEAYDALAAQPGYRRMQRHCPIMATWDDHDYGANDMGRDFQFRTESRDLFFEFFGFGPNDVARKHEGIYHSRSFGPAGKRVQIIMLDTRYNRDSLEKGEREGKRGPYVPTSDTSKTILGEAQWKWLAKELREPADIRIIASSIQVVADEHGYETWGNFPHERQRLYNLIDETDASGVVFLSGDRHLTEISVDRGRGGRAELRVPYPMWDFTSSGLTQAPEMVRDRNSYRVGPAAKETNFGVVEIRWGQSPETTEIRFTARGDQGQMLTGQSVFLSDLRERR